MMIKPFHIIIPARLNSSRLPGKMLLDLDGKPLIQQTYESALKCGAASVTIATDDTDIKNVAHSFGANVCMTSVDHLTGTDRLAEAAMILKLKEEDIVVNIQGDEPLVSIQAVHKLVIAMQDNKAACTATLCTPIRDKKHLLDPNIVKVVLDNQGFALYFSRASIPFDRAGDNELLFNPYYRHLGLYAYRVHTLQQYVSWEPCPIELVERLEQLRILWQGEKIHVSIMEEILPPGVDTLADLEVMREFFATV